ncbi:MAG TPA: TusE/DsrC/DsvC family sulfur relay protein [Polyangiaceae bacterium]|nr:TusE/DsrC/DsvC family sulfur relay protein [Polyangiaceae bacterium]
MPSRTLADRTVDVNEQGYLLNPNDWTEPMAEAIAREVGIALTPEAWKVVRFARKDFAEKAESPGLRRITANTGVSTKELYQMFPKGPGKLIALIAGTPKPKSCL